jgi:hypothetical protein
VFNEEVKFQHGRILSTDMMHDDGTTFSGGGVQAVQPILSDFSERAKSQVTAVQKVLLA